MAINASSVNALAINDGDGEEAALVAVQSCTYSDLLVAVQSYTYDDLYGFSR